MHPDGDPAARTVVARASAKVNLQLAVGARQDDGYHPLATVFQAVGLYDTVSATARDDDEVVLTVESAPALNVPPGAVPTDATNLAVRAAAELRERYGAPYGLDLAIAKGIPVAGGMAGGSADAAAALVACNEAWGLELGREALAEVAAELGADVPFSMLGHTAIGTGRGDLLSPVMTSGHFRWVFGLQSEGLSTPAVYGEFDRAVEQGERIAAPPQISVQLMAALRAGDSAALAPLLTNDLQDAALAMAPHLRETIAAAADAGALAAIVSGSGPTVAALASSRQHALAVAAGLTASGTVTAALVADGPADGAVVVDQPANRQRR